MPTSPRRDSRDDGAAPALLPTFFAGTLAMVGAIVAMARIDNDWADLGAVAVLVLVAGFLLFSIARRIGDDEDEQT